MSMRRRTDTRQNCFEYRDIIVTYHVLFDSYILANKNLALYISENHDLFLAEREKVQRKKRLTKTDTGSLARGSRFLKQKENI